jgi:ribonuclease III
MPPPELPAAAEALSKLVDELPPELRGEALTHSSWTDSRSSSYGRLAFLGDRVLGLAIASEIHSRHPGEDSGRLTKIHTHAVSAIACAQVAHAIGVPERLRATAPEAGGMEIPVEVLLGAERPVPEIAEALIGACYVAFGYERTAEAVIAAFAPRIEHAAETRIDFKSDLQELLARRGARVTYEVVATSGPPHKRTFEVAARLDTEEVGRGSGRSKKVAEQAAAEQALEHLGG